MKILHITKKYPQALAGDAVAVSNLEKQQLQRRDKVAVLTSNCDEITADKLHYKFGLRDTPAALDAITLRRLLSLAALTYKAFRVIKKEKPDVVHTHSIDMALAASFAAQEIPDQSQVSEFRSSGIRRSSCKMSSIWTFECPIPRPISI